MIKMCEDDCIKRIIKAYLHFKGEARTADILKHIDSVGYGLRKKYTVAGLTNKIKYWSYASKSGSWFNVECFKKNNVYWWRLK